MFISCRIVTFICIITWLLLHHSLTIDIEGGGERLLKLKYAIINRTSYITLPIYHITTKLSIKLYNSGRWGRLTNKIWE